MTIKLFVALNDFSLAATALHLSAKAMTTMSTNGIRVFKPGLAPSRVWGLMVQENVLAP